MSAPHSNPSTLKRMAMRGATVAIGGLAVLGASSGMASASTSGHGDWGHHPDHHGQSSSLVDLSHNQVPIQACHNQVPVNALGVQVPVHDVTGALGLGVLGSAGEGHAAQDAPCNQGSAQHN